MMIKKIKFIVIAMLFIGSNSFSVLDTSLTDDYQFLINRLPEVIYKNSVKDAISNGDLPSVQTLVLDPKIYLINEEIMLMADGKGEIQRVLLRAKLGDLVIKKDLEAIKSLLENFTKKIDKEMMYILEKNEDTRPFLMYMKYFKENLKNKFVKGAENKGKNFTDCLLRTLS
jgi:hypothetical protein